MTMPGPDAKVRKHGRTPNSGTNTGEWLEYPDVPFDGAPAMPKAPGRRKTWHPIVEQWWLTVSTLPHAVDWRPDDWLKVYELMEEKESYYAADREERKTTQLTEIRRREDALGIGSDARKARKIRYVPVAEEPAEKPARGTPQETTAAGKVVPLRDRRAAITAGSQASSATG